jgi:hypothetical protein
MGLPAGTSDEEKWRRLNEIMDKLKARPGRVSRKNIAAIATRLGFDLLEYNETGDTTMTLAGGAILIDIHISSQETITNVEISHPEASSALQETAMSASAVLQQGLTPKPGESSITKMLDKFAINLEKLAKIDRPNGPNNDNFSCFEAISGIYSSLRRLYDYELEIAAQVLELSDRKEEKAAAEVACKKSGRPRMNENGNIGLDVDYWTTRRHIYASTDCEPLENETFTLSIACEGLQPGQMIQPARISEAWISEQVKKKNEPDAGLDAVLDWLEPPPAMVQPQVSADASENTSMQSTEGKLPNVRFVAKLRPPLLIPGEAATHSRIVETCTFDPATPYVPSLLLRQNALESATQPYPRELFAERSTTVGGVHERHANTLRIRTYEQSVLLREIPFDHPKQLIQLLPVSKWISHSERL